MQKILLILVAITLCSHTNTSTAEIKYNDRTVKSSVTNSDKLFIREYTYNASEDDSKNSSRKKAIEQIKSILSQEVGTHIRSSLNIKQTTKNGVSQKHVKQEINSLSASITKLKILDEKWNGATYYIKASVRINEEETMTLLLEAIKAKASEKDIKRLNKILSEQNKDLDKSYNKINNLQKTLLAQEIKNQASINELKESKKQLSQLQRDKKTYDRKVLQSKSEIARVTRLIKIAKDRIRKENKKACMVSKGMTKNEIINSVGRPTGDNEKQTQRLYGRPSDEWYYGSIKIEFARGSYDIVEKISGCY